MNGLTLALPSPKWTRPTSNRIRQSIFNILEHGLKIDFSKAKVLDLFAGSGAMGLEALSRGALSVIFIENNVDVFQILKKNCDKYCQGMEEPNSPNIISYLRDALTFQTNELFNLIFLDPPYGKVDFEKIFKRIIPLATADATIVLETDMNAPCIPPASFKIVRQKRYGQTQIHFFQCKND